MSDTWPGQPEQAALAWPGQAEQTDAPAPPISGPDGWSEAGKPFVNSTGIGSIMRAFGHGFGEAWGPERLGLSKESTEWLSKSGIFASGSKYENPFQAFNEGVIVNSATALDAAWRTAGGIFRGGQGAVYNALGETPFARDVAALPEAFMGSPGTLGRPKFTNLVERPGAASSATFPEWFSGSKAADGHGNPIPVYHGTSIEITKEGFSSFDESKLGKATGAPSAKEAFFFSESPDVAKSYADGASAYEDMAALRIANKLTGGLYEKANEGFLGIFGRSAKADGRIVTAALDTKNPLVVDMAGKEFREESFHSIIQRAKDAGHDGVLFRNAIDPGFAEGGDKPSNIWAVFKPEQVKIAQFQKVTDLTLPQAQDLGVIGPERPPISEGTPKEAAERVTSANAEGPRGEKVTQELHGQKDPWQERFDGFVSKLEAPADVQQLIRDAAKENGDFLPARQGDIPLSHVEGIADAAGVDAREVNARGLGRKLQNDNEVRIAMRMMLQVTDDVKNAAREVKADGSPENLIKLQESIMRRDLAVEQVVGLRAEWGRTGNVIQEFMRDVKDQEGLNNFLKDKGRSPADLRDIAHTIDALDRGQAARLLNDMRTPTAWDKFRWYWINALISGPVTHTKYAIANTAFGLYESALVTPIAGGIGTARRALTGGREGVFMGEAAARTWGIVAGVPDALVASVKAARTGMQTALPGEIAQNIIPKNNKNLPFQQKPAGGALGTVIGLPSRGASAIHSFFNFLGYRASIEAQAYRAAAKDGLSVSDDAFWQRRASAADKPSVEMMNSAIEEGYRLTFITELSEGGRKMSSFVNSTKLGQLVMPFVHIPMNILRRSLEGTPAAFLDLETREALAGKHGAVKQDMAVARMVAGSAIGAWAVNQVLNDRMTGFGPTEQKERAQWLATGHNPYSIRIGDEWYSFNRFGPIGTMMGLYANLSETIPHMKPDSEELTKAVTMAVHSTGRLMMDEVGMQGLAGLIEAIEDPGRRGTRFVSSFAGSLLPYSSALRQTASAMDPYMRETKSVVDGLRYYIPAVRLGLHEKRDWLGSPIANAGYGGDIEGAPGASAIIQHRSAVADPVSLEAAALDVRPAPPQDRIHGVKLTPKLFDTYQATAGPFLRQTLESYINAPGWHDMPTFVRQEMFHNAIKTSRSTAAAAMQMQYPELIQQAVKDRVDRINGVKPTKKLTD